MGLQPTPADENHYRRIVSPMDSRFRGNDVIFSRVEKSEVEEFPAVRPCRPEVKLMVFFASL